MSAKPQVTIDLGPSPEDLAISVAMAPYVSMVGVMTESLAGKDRGLPRSIKQVVRGAAASAGRAALRPLSSPDSSVTPDCICPVTPRSDVSTETYLEVMRATSAETITGDLTKEFGPDVPERWQGPLRQPRRWLSDFADTADRAWQELEPLWSRARPLIDRDVERVGLTLVRGGVEAVLNSLSPRISCVDGVLSFDDVFPGDYSLSGRRLVLVPIISGPRMLISSVDDADVVWIGYPVPGIARIAGAPSHVFDHVDHTEDRLALVLGGTRSALIRYLARPAIMREAARDLDLAPSTLTFHCDHLERAGLVSRERRGTQVRLSRTERADRLIDLMDPR